MKVLIVEDEPLTARKLQRTLAEVEPTAEVVGLTAGIEESVVWIEINPPPDLILMDIELADGQSFEIFRRVEVKSPVIFTTAYDEFAIRAFKVNSIDYLLKPIKKEDLRLAIGKLRQMREVLGQNESHLRSTLKNLLAELAPPSRPQYRERFLIKQGQKMWTLEGAQVAYFFSKQKLTFARTHEGRDFLVDYTLEDVENELDPLQFFRLNRQIVSSRMGISKVQQYFNRKLKLSLTPDFAEDVLVGREKVKEFKLWLGE